MDYHKRIILMIVLAVLGGFVLSASSKHRPSAPHQRSMRYTSRSADDARAWQRDVRAKLFQQLKTDDLIARRILIPLNPKELSHADRRTYHIKEVEINSTLGRCIRIIVTVPRTKHGLVPAVVCIGGHGSNLYSPYDPQTIKRIGRLLEIPAGYVPMAMGDDIRQTWVSNNYPMEGIVHEHDGESHVDDWGIEWTRTNGFNQIGHSD